MATCRIYKPRDPRKTPLHGFLDWLYELVEGVWEERFERSYGFWRGLVDEASAFLRVAASRTAVLG